MGKGIILGQSGGGGNKVFIDGEAVKGKTVTLTSYLEFEQVSSMTYPLRGHTAIINLEGNPEIFGGYEASSSTNHFKYDMEYSGGTWTAKSSLPFNMDSGTAIVVADKVCIFGGNHGSKDMFARNKGKTTWSSYSSSLETTIDGATSVLNDKKGHIHVFLDNVDLMFNEETGIRTLRTGAPYGLTGHNQVVLDNDGVAHFVGSTSRKQGYNYYKGEISDSGAITFTQQTSLHYAFSGGFPYVNEKNNLVLLGGENTPEMKRTLINGEWKKEDLPEQVVNSEGLIIDGQVNLFGGWATSSSVSNKHRVLKDGYKAIVE